MPVTITIPDDLAERLERLRVCAPPSCNCSTCQIAALIDKSKFALSTAPVDGSGAVDALAGEEQTTCTCGDVCITWGADYYDADDASRHYFDGRPCVEYEQLATLTTTSVIASVDIPDAPYGLRGH